MVENRVAEYLFEDRKRQAVPRCTPPCGSGESGGPDVLDHDVVRELDVRLTEESPIVLSGAPGNGDQPES